MRRSILFKAAMHVKLIHAGRGEIILKHIFHLGDVSILFLKDFHFFLNAVPESFNNGFALGGADWVDESLSSLGEPFSSLDICSFSVLSELLIYMKLFKDIKLK